MFWCKIDWWFFSISARLVVLHSFILAINFFSTWQVIGPAWYRAKCTASVVGYTILIWCLHVVIVPKCISLMDSNSDNMLEKRFAVLFVRVLEADLAAPFLFRLLFVFGADSSVLCHSCGTVFDGIVVYGRYSVNRVDVCWIFATL